MFEFRGVDKLYFAEVLQDDANGYVCDTPQILSPVAEISKSVDSSQATHYYDNRPMVVINSEGPDTITLTVAPPDLAILAKITGRSFDPVTGMMVDNPPVRKKFAIMYRTKGTDGAYRYVSRLKGEFSIPQEDNKTQDDSTDAGNTQLTFTGLATAYEFTKGVYDASTSTWEKSGVKGIVVDERYNLVSLSTFFNSVQTPDTVGGAAPSVAGISIGPSDLTLNVDDTYTLKATLYPAGAVDTITWAVTSGGTYASVDTNGKVTALASGSATVTATCNGHTDTCAVTVS